MRARTLILTASMLIAGAQADAAQRPDVSFQGKTITIYVGFDPGGSYDLYGRLIARYLGGHLPGRPTIVAQNMPGAGSFAAANFLFRVAPKDGTALGVLTEAIAIEEALHMPGIQYRADDFNWIGRMTSILELTYTGPKSKVRTIQDAMRIETPVADTGAGSSSDGHPKLLNALAGTKFKPVSGYPGSSQAMMAVESGEVDGAETSWSTLTRTRPAWIKNHQVGLLVQYALKRSAELPDVPTDVELGKTDEAKKVLAFYTSGAEVGRSLAAPPGLTPDTVRILRAGFDAMLKDPGFLAEVKRDKVDFRPASGAELQQLIRATVDAPREVVDKTQQLVGASAP